MTTTTSPTGSVLRSPSSWITTNPTDEADVETPDSQRDRLGIKKPVHTPNRKYSQHMDADGVSHVFPTTPANHMGDPSQSSVMKEPPSTSLSKARMNKRFLEMMRQPSTSEETMSETDEGEDSPTESASSGSSKYSENRRFWIGLMNRVDSQSTTSQYTSDASSMMSGRFSFSSASQGIPTPMGRKIFRSPSNASSITTPRDDDNHGRSLKTPRSTISAGSQPRVATEGSQWKSPTNHNFVSPTASQGSKRNEKTNENAFSFSNLPPTPQSAHALSHAPCNNNDNNNDSNGNHAGTPRMFGDDRTNSVNTPTVLSTPQHNHDHDHGQNQKHPNTGTSTNPQRHPNEAEQEQPANQLSVKIEPSPGSQNPDDRYTPLATARLKAYRKSLSTGSPLPDWIGEIHPSPGQNRRSTPLGKCSPPLRAATDAKNDGDMAKSMLSPDLSIPSEPLRSKPVASPGLVPTSIQYKTSQGADAPPSPAIRASHLSTPKMTSRKPRRAEQNPRFQKAYDAWARVGLMKATVSSTPGASTTPVPSTATVSSASSIVRTATRPPTIPTPSKSDAQKWTPTSLPKVHSKTEQHIASLQTAPSRDYSIQPVSSEDVRDLPHMGSGDTRSTSQCTSMRMEIIPPVPTYNDDESTLPSMQETLESRSTIQDDAKENDSKQHRRTDSDSSGFHDILNHWKTVSADKPNTHFLSPEQKKWEKERQDQRRRSSFRRPPRSEDKKKSQQQRQQQEQQQQQFQWKSLSSPLKGSSKDFLDETLNMESPSSQTDDHDESFPPQDFSIDVDVDSDIDTGSVVTGSNARKPAADHFRKIRSLVDSDIFEDDCTVADDDPKPNRALVMLENERTFEVTVGGAQQSPGKEGVSIRNLSPFDEAKKKRKSVAPCECSKSVFSGNDNLVDFFLPKLGMACTCGRSDHGIVNVNDPTAIENILRPWQVTFVKAFGVDRGDQLVKARHRSGRIMTRALCDWRRREGLVYFDLNSCSLAIDIWAKTCKAYVRSVRKQIKEGERMLEQQPGPILRELSRFVNELPPEPKRREDQIRYGQAPHPSLLQHELDGLPSVNSSDISIDYDLESQVEV